MDRESLAKIINMHRRPRSYYQIYRVDHKRDQEQIVAEVEGMHEAEKLVEKYLRNMNSARKMKLAIACQKSYGGQLIN